MDGWPERRVFLGPLTVLKGQSLHFLSQHSLTASCSTRSIYTAPLSLLVLVWFHKFPEVLPSYSFQKSSFLLHLQTKQGPSVHWHSLKREWHTQDCVGYHESMVKEGRVGGLLRKVWVLTWPVKLSSLATTLVAFSLFLSTLFLFYFIFCGWGWGQTCIIRRI